MCHSNDFGGKRERAAGGKEGLELREPQAAYKRPYSKRRQSPEWHATPQVLQVTLALMETPQNRFFASPKTGCEGVWRFRGVGGRGGGAILMLTPPPSHTHPLFSPLPPTPIPPRAAYLCIFIEGRWLVYGRSRVARIEL